MDALGIDIGGSSIKIAALRDDQCVWKDQSRSYFRPNREQLLAAIQSAVSSHISAGEALFSVGLCVPGILDPAGEMVIDSINVPGLIGVRLKSLMEGALGRSIPQFRIVNDAIATGLDLMVTRKLSSRVIVIALGTGVGMSVMDGVDQPLRADGDSPGHIGQFDVSLETENPPIGPDGGAGSLEAYIGAPALCVKYGRMENFFASVSLSDAPIRALARAIRICHAIYRPNHVILAGGTGVRLSPIAPGLKKLIDTSLTRIARADWTLTCADHDFHAAIGAARAAMAEA